MTKSDSLTQHCVYMIATGKWQPGERLPSIRTMRREWGLNQEAVQAAYGRLVEAGLVESRTRSGYFVRSGTKHDRLSQHRSDLEALHADISQLIRSETGLSVLGVLRYLARLEEIERQQTPEVVFIECTEAQARGHAGEISERLQIPVAAMTTTELARKNRAMMKRVSTILTSSFHVEEVGACPGSRDATVVSVPIEVSPRIRERLDGLEGELVLLESEESMASHIAEDAAEILGSEPRTEIVEDPSATLERLLTTSGRGKRPGAVILSPRLWGALDETWQNDRRVLQVSFRIADAAWDRIVEECGFPF